MEEKVDEFEWMREIPSTKTYKISGSGMSMEISQWALEIIKSTSLLPNTFNIYGDKLSLGNFTWNLGGYDYGVKVFILPVKMTSGEVSWRVAGRLGNYGFNLTYVNKRNTIPKRGREEIFKQIIDRFGLDDM